MESSFYESSTVDEGIGFSIGSSQFKLHCALHWAFEAQTPLQWPSGWICNMIIDLHLNGETVPLPVVQSWSWVTRINDKPVLRKFHSSSGTMIYKIPYRKLFFAVAELLFSKNIFNKEFIVHFFPSWLVSGNESL